VFDPEGPTFFELMRQALASTERGYDLIAPKFDRTPFRTPEPILVALTRLIAAEPVATALDVCCGTGAAMMQLRAVCSDRVVGIDFSEGMLAEARRRAAQAPGEARVELIRGDALDLPFVSEIDVVTCVGAFGHIVTEDEDRFVAGVAKALVRGGRFVFATSRRPPPTKQWLWMAHGFNAVMRLRNALLKPPFIMYYLTFLWPEVKPLLERHGFVVEAHEDLCPPPYSDVVIVSARRPS
jgi:ubiquinone/menaquinone biosynthesis C-methylase UbiE